MTDEPDPIEAGVAAVLDESETNDLLVEYDTGDLAFSVEFAEFDPGEPLYNVASLPEDGDHVQRVVSASGREVAERGDVYVTLFAAPDEWPRHYAEVLRGLAGVFDAGDEDTVEVSRRSL